MREIETSYVIEPSSSALLEYMSPRRILEAAEIYEIRSHETTGHGEEFTVAFEDTEMRIAFDELERGYAYTFVDGGEMFAHRETTITVDDGDEATVDVTTRYTFDSFWSFVLDRLAAGTVTTELEQTVGNMVAAVAEAEGNAVGPDDDRTDERDE
ncbi:hypothetical protein [Halopiger goleimassiliensis]|uniref:hypothetical protein n=1 Tax=Halopiger goleimassiliensis TaxID=1293048 RepID=UPI000677C249|nr:hypothetical protein [Halopiger goleimassiliensis]